jgi:hypothetical protein
MMEADESKIIQSSNMETLRSCGEGGAAYRILRPGDIGYTEKSFAGKLDGFIKWWGAEVSYSIIFHPIPYF